MTHIATRFPEPDHVILYAFTDLQVARVGTDDEKADRFGDANPTALPRPWDPPSCPPTLRAHVWIWLDRVAAWINHDYSWRLERTIPACWPAHPHIASELAVIASLRHDAGRALTPEPLEDWHRYALPSFLDRMDSRLGPTGCPPGKHHDWPGQARYKDFQSPASIARRLDAFTADTNRHAIDSAQTDLATDPANDPAVAVAVLDGGESPS